MWLERVKVCLRSFSRRHVVSDQFGLETATGAARGEKWGLNAGRWWAAAALTSPSTNRYFVQLAVAQVHSGVEGGALGAAWLIRCGHAADVKWSKILTASGAAAPRSPCNASGLKCQADVSTPRLKFTERALVPNHTHAHTHTCTNTLGACFIPTSSVHRWPSKDKGAATSATVASSIVSGEKWDPALFAAKQTTAF